MNSPHPSNQQIMAASKPLLCNQLQPPKKVLIVQQVFKQYRLAFFQQLAEQLTTDGIELTLCFSAPQASELSKADNILSPPAAYAKLIPSKTFGPLVWQSVPELASFDLVIVEQANRHLLNYLLLLQRRWKKAPKVIFWGHGFNHQAVPGFWSRLKQHFKKWQLGLADGFFAYTQQVGAYAIQQGIAAERITVLNNSIDTTAFCESVQRLRQQQAVRTKARPTLIFCGALYPDKLIALVLQTAKQLAAQQCIEKLIVLGDGPDKSLIAAALKTQNEHPQQPRWIDYRGACFGEDKAAAYAEADLVLNPGLVGLAILDAFAAGLPLVTTHFPGHSPEISYLVHGYNGLMVDAQHLALELQQLLRNPHQLQLLADGAANSSAKYHLEAMVEAFAGGVRQTMAQSNEKSHAPSKVQS
jgi:glycosyltransferase involved in cell wall biosynthesis